MSEIVKWSFPTAILFGAGAAEQTGAELKALGAQKVLIVTDAGVRKVGLLDTVVAGLDAAGLTHAVWDGVEGNPLERHVDEGLSAYRDAGADALLAVGGGSSMDVAKVVAMRVHHGGPLGDYDDAIGGDRLVTGEVPPIVAIPTTAGTGSEVGRSGVVTLAATGRKTVIFSPKLLPRLAVLDPLLTRTLPAHITAATGYDALTHCLEALVAKGDHPMADGIAREGIRLVAGALRRAVRDGDDLAARGDMLKAAMMGAVAFQKGLGACHSLAHPLSSVCGLHHGLANALCLPATVRFNAQHDATFERYAEVATMLGADEASGEGCALALEALRADIGLPARLSDRGVETSHLDKLADEAIADICHTLNPIACTRADLAALYQAAF